GKCREGVRAEAGASSEIGRKIFTNESAREAETLDVMVFERNCVEAARHFIAFMLGWSELCMIRSTAGIPVEKFCAGGVIYGSTGEFAANGIDKPFAAGSLGVVGNEFRTKPEAVLSRGHSSGVVRSATDGHGGA